MRNAPPLLLTFVVAVPALAACEPSPLNLIQVRAGCPNMPLRGPAEFPPVAPEDVIDDWDDGDMWLTRIAGRTGSWVGYGTPGQATALGEPSNACVASGAYSGHLTGVDLVNFQSNWNGTFIDPFSGMNTFNANGYTGFSFWVAAGDKAVRPLEDMPIGLMTRDTTAGGDVCAGAGCADYYRTRIPLTTTWTRWVVRFMDLAQSGQQGAPQQPLNITQLVSVMIWPQKNYDIWIDDVRFER
jgi:hypothetical protein